MTSWSWSYNDCGGVSIYGEPPLSKVEITKFKAWAKRTFNKDLANILGSRILDEYKYLCKRRDPSIHGGGINNYSADGFIQQTPWSELPDSLRVEP